MFYNDPVTGQRVDLPAGLPQLMTNQAPVCVGATGGPCPPNNYASRLFAVQVPVGIDPGALFITITSSEGGSATSPITRVR
jgi:hypothetical protein